MTDKETRIREIVRKIAEAERLGGGFRLYFETAVAELLEICGPLEPRTTDIIASIAASLTSQQAERLVSSLSDQQEDLMRQAVDHITGVATRRGT